MFRALSLHLYVVWEKKLGKKFRIISLASILIGTIALTVLPNTLTGVSYQLGNVCYFKPSINNWSFWAPLIILAVVIFVLQIWTLVHCVMSVVRGIWDDRRYSSHMTFYHDGRTSRQSHKLFTSMQWRPMLAAFGIVLHVALFSALFITVRNEHNLPSTSADAWVNCLISSPDDPARCLPEARGLGPNENFVFACLLLLSVSNPSISILMSSYVQKANGLLLLFFLFRPLAYGVSFS